MSDNLNIGCIKTIILDTPETCLQAEVIINDLIEKNYIILPIVPHPNKIHISYIDHEPDENVKKNIVTCNSGNFGLAFC